MSCNFKWNLATINLNFRHFEYGYERGIFKIKAFELALAVILNMATRALGLNFI